YGSDFTAAMVKQAVMFDRFVDFTYVKKFSKELDAQIKKEIAQFRDILRASQGLHSGQISLEFYHKHKGRWPFQADSFPWKVWSVKLNVITLHNENDRSEFKTKLFEQLSDKVFSIIDVINRHECLPRMPAREEEGTPYLFRIYHQTTGPSPTL
ncbi:unnamed protein product, partial [Candidula unifasciata]